MRINTDNSCRNYNNRRCPVTLWRDFFRFIPQFKLTLLINLSHPDAIIAQRTAGYALHLARQI